MLLIGAKEYSKDGGEVKTAMVVGRATKDGELKTTKNGKTYGAVGVKALNRQDGTAVFIEVKSFQSTWAELIAGLDKYDTFMAAGRLENREYNGKIYTDLLADIVIPVERLAPLLSGSHAPSYAASAAPVGGPSDFAELGEEDGELPF